MLLQVLEVHAQAQQRLDPGDQLQPVDGQEEEVVGTDPAAAEAGVEVVLRRHQDHRQELGLRVDLDLAAQLDTPAAGEVHVEQDQVGLGLVDGGEELGLGRRGHDLVPLVAQDPLQELADGGGAATEEDPAGADGAGQGEQLVQPARWGPGRRTAPAPPGARPARRGMRPGRASSRRLAAAAPWLPPWLESWS